MYMACNAAVSQYLGRMPEARYMYSWIHVDTWQYDIYTSNRRM